LWRRRLRRHAFVPAFVDRRSYNLALAAGRAAADPRLAPAPLMRVLLQSAIQQYALMLTYIERSRRRIFAANHEDDLAQAVQNDSSLTPELRRRIQDAFASLGPNGRTALEAGPLTYHILRGFTCLAAPAAASQEAVL